MQMGIQYFCHGRICLWHDNFLDSRVPWPTLGQARE